MTAAVLLDHVSAYAAAVRSHLRDLPPEQVDDLTDGLEADLAEALEDPHGPVATGEIPIGRAVASAGVPAPGTSDVPGGAGQAAIIDLARRFGPAAEYAAELRAAAGLAPAGSRVPRRRPGVRLAGLADGVRERWHLATDPVTSSPHWAGFASFAASLRPLWWVLRGWLWFVIVVTVVGPLTSTYVANDYVPRNEGTWLLLAGTLLLSIQLGRGLRPRLRWVRRAVAAANIVAILAAPAITSAFRQDLDRAIAQEGYPVYVDNPVYLDAPRTDGVWVEGMQVSNLFVYDAEGNPLSGVQIFDDRGRQVRTTTDDGVGEWSLPGVAEPWSFAPSLDADGRARWNVYPLTGAPVSGWVLDDEGRRTLNPGTEASTPPQPFAKAPTVVVPGDVAEGTAGTTGDEPADAGGDTGAGDTRAAAVGSDPGTAP